MKRLSFSFLLVFFAVAERVWFDLGPNVELVMTASILATQYLGRKWGIFVALLSLITSDLIIGNSLILLFTWSAFVLIAAGSYLIKRRAVIAAGYGLAASLFFYVYTNFGVWLIGGLYPRTFTGLINSYVMGLPFLRLHALTSVLFLFASVSLFNKLIVFKHQRGIRFNSGAVPQL